MIYIHSERASNCNIRHIILSIFLCGNIFFSEAQEIPFVPLVYSYSAGIMSGGGNQNWAVEQGSNGVIYIGNNKGLLSFDGTNWLLHRLPNGLSVKSICIDQSSGSERIYVGSYEEFGYFSVDLTNQLVYHSLKSLVRDYKFQNDEIWTILKLNEIIYFQTFSSYFVYNTEKKTVTAEKPIPGPLYFFEVGGRFSPNLSEEISTGWSKGDLSVYSLKLKSMEILSFLFCLVTTDSSWFLPKTVSIYSLLQKTNSGHGKHRSMPN